jgi:hypothetical protein
MSTIQYGFKKSSPPERECAEGLVKLKKHLRLERSGYSIIIIIGD